MVSVTLGATRRPLSAPELIGMVAGLMALNALAIDIMLPALPDIGASFGLTDPNRAQLVITAYVFGFGVAQLFYGPLADALGRRTVLIGSMLAFIAGTILCVVADSFELLIAARVLQGVAAAATRVIATAVVRDLTSGRRMAEVMSFALTIFMIAPILAPGLGQLILFGATWPWIFGTLLMAGVGILAWAWFRLPETLAPENRMPLNARATARAYMTALRNRVTLGYMLASGFVFGSLFAFIATSEQIFATQFGLGAAFTIAFAGIAIGLSAANFINARLVGRFGMRRLSHGALIAFVSISLIHAGVAELGFASFPVFYVLLALTMFLFGMIGANFSAVVMEPAGANAGVTASLYGAVTSVFGAVLGGVVGMAYDGTVLPLVLGQALLGAAALLAVFIAERGKLFAGRPIEPAPKRVIP